MMVLMMVLPAPQPTPVPSAGPWCDGSVEAAQLPPVEQQLDERSPCAALVGAHLLRGSLRAVVMEGDGSVEAAQLPPLEQQLDVPRAALVGGHEDSQGVARQHKDL
eukprot:4447219-Pyramimonas_sp.AAC.1